MILTKLADSTRNRVEREKKQIQLEMVKKQALAMKKGDFAFEKIIAEGDISFICEVKRASPSKGMLVEEFPYVQIAKDYEEAGASCISVLTEPDYFKGDKQYLKEISENVTVPLIRKDFIIDEYMIYEAKVIGASAVLLICSLLSEAVLAEWIELCESLGLSALVETHDEEEIRRAVRAGARIIGVNNRDLKTFQVDINNCLRLREKIPENILFVAESGIRTREDIEALEQGGVSGVLIGETLMRSGDKKKTLAKLRGMDVSK